jgi:hypothetical protein
VSTAVSTSTIDGHPGNVTRRIRAVIRRAHKRGLVATFTTDGSHAPGSWHKVILGRNRLGHAVDVGFTQRGIDRLSPHQRRRILIDFQTSEYKRAKRLRWRTYKELLGPHDGLCILQGQPVGLVNGTALENAHDNHVHVAR